MFCAIDAWDGAMPHDEIAMCLDVDRITVCQTEKKVVDKLKKRISFKNFKALKDCSDASLVSVKGLAKTEEASSIEEISSFICSEFNIVDPVEIRFTNKKIEMNNKIGKALYEHENGKHKITFNSLTTKNKKDLIETLTHELFHVLQIEENKKFSESSEKMADLVMVELSPKYYRKYLSISKKMSNNKMTGEKR